MFLVFLLGCAIDGGNRGFASNMLALLAPTGSLGVWGRGASNSSAPSGGPSLYIAVGDAWLLP